MDTAISTMMIHSRNSIRRLVARSARHRTMFRLWLVIYAFVGIQMGWVLRPFVGHPAAPVQFFRSGMWGNAYVEVARTAWRAIGM